MFHFLTLDEMRKIFLVIICLLGIQMMSSAQLKVSQDGVRAELSSGNSSETNGCMLVNTNNYAVEVNYNVTFIKKSGENTQEFRKDKTIKLAAYGTPKGPKGSCRFWVSAKSDLPIDFKETSVFLSVTKLEVQSAQSNKLGAHTEVILNSGRIIYIEEKDNGVGPARNMIRKVLNKVNWPSGFAACASQHDADYGTLGVSKYDADMKLKRCAASVFPGTVGDFIKQQGWTLRQLSVLIGLYDITEDMKFSECVFKLMGGTNGDESYREGQQMAQTTERYKSEVEKILGMSIDTSRYYFILSR
jgi:hypothetical protein